MRLVSHQFVIGTAAAEILPANILRLGLTLFGGNAFLGGNDVTVTNGVPASVATPLPLGLAFTGPVYAVSPSSGVVYAMEVFAL